MSQFFPRSKFGGKLICVRNRFQGNHAVPERPWHLRRKSMEGEAIRREGGIGDRLIQSATDFLRNRSLIFSNFSLISRYINLRCPKRHLTSWECYFFWNWFLIFSSSSLVCRNINPQFLKGYLRSLENITSIFEIYLWSSVDEGTFTSLSGWLMLDFWANWSLKISIPDGPIIEGWENFWKKIHFWLLKNWFILFMRNSFLFSIIFHIICFSKNRFLIFSERCATNC